MQSSLTAQSSPRRTNARTTAGFTWGLSSSACRGSWNPRNPTPVSGPSGASVIVAARGARASRTETTPRLVESHLHTATRSGVRPPASTQSAASGSSSRSFRITAPASSSFTGPQCARPPGPCGFNARAATCTGVSPSRFLARTTAPARPAAAAALTKTSTFAARPSRQGLRRISTFLFAPTSARSACSAVSLLGYFARNNWIGLSSKMKRNTSGGCAGCATAACSGIAARGASSSSSSAGLASPVSFSSFERTYSPQSTSSRTFRPPAARSASMMSRGTHRSSPAFLLT